MEWAFLLLAMKALGLVSVGLIGMGIAWVLWAFLYNFISQIWSDTRARLSGGKIDYDNLEDRSGSDGR